MFLKTLRQRSAQKKIEKFISRRSAVHEFEQGTIAKVAILAKLENRSQVAQLQTILAGKGIASDNCNVLYFLGEREDVPEEGVATFNSDGFSIQGKAKEPGLVAFLDERYQLLVNYYEEDQNWPLKLASSLCKADFCVGNAKVDKRLNDLVIECNLQDAAAFADELIKYLTILNKL